jgi:acetolactate synthase-1/2/3 large subunit
MKLSDYIAKFFKEKGSDICFAITGAGNIRIIESLSNVMKYVCPHHEQAAVMSAITYWRTSNKLPVVTVTGGPGALNSLIGLADAHLDSIPLILLAGQEKAEYVKNHAHMRALGVQGLKMWEVVQNLTKKSYLVTNPDDIHSILEEAYIEATTGRPGPVWIEVPQDLQWVEVKDENVNNSDIQIKNNIVNDQDVEYILSAIKSAKRPLIWSGNGIRLSDSLEQFKSLLEKLQIPVLSTWQAADIIKDDHPLFVGRAGQYGQRHANFALQSCDLLLCLGTRVALPQRGFKDSNFAPNAKKIIVDIDSTELSKFEFENYKPICSDVKQVIEKLSNKVDEIISFEPWLSLCNVWKKKYSMVNEDYSSEGINSYFFIDKLSDYLNDDEIIVTDMGTSLTCTHATIRLKKDQRIITSTGLGEMGFGIPGAVGACLASGKRVVLVCGEGSLMMNLQELQTVQNLNLPIIFLMLNNSGYLTIKHTHHALYKTNGNATATDASNGVTFPNFKKIAYAFDFDYEYVDDEHSFQNLLDKFHDINKSVFVEIKMPEYQELIPKMAVQINEKGEMFTPSLEYMYPFLPEDIVTTEMQIARSINEH